MDRVRRVSARRKSNAMYEITLQIINNLVMRGSLEVLVNLVVGVSLSLWIIQILGSRDE